MHWVPFEKIGTLQTLEVRDVCATSVNRGKASMWTTSHR
jgi:hypothetical protein